MTGSIKILVKCPACGKSLMNPDVRLDDLPSIDLETKIEKKSGHIYLSQVYGSYNKNLMVWMTLRMLFAPCSAHNAGIPSPCIKHVNARRP